LTSLYVINWCDGEQLPQNIADILDKEDGKEPTEDLDDQFLSCSSDESDDDDDDDNE